MFTDSPLPMPAAESEDDALAHRPSGQFQADAAWSMLAVITHNLTRALAALAGAEHRRERTATTRRTLI